MGGGGGGGGGARMRAATNLKLMRRGVLVVKTTSLEGNDRPKIEAVVLSPRIL